MLYSKVINIYILVINWI